MLCELHMVHMVLLREADRKYIAFEARYAFTMCVMPRSRPRLFLLTLIAMFAFAANSVLCRMALKQATIDAGSFTAIRLLSGAGILWLLVILRGNVSTRTMFGKGSWQSALVLLAYAAGFSFAYVSLPAGTGALLLFAAVQVTMVGHGLHAGEELGSRQWLGLLLACAGLVVLVLPGVSMPPLGSAALMLAAGVAWGIYSLRGRVIARPLEATAANFMRAALISLPLVVCMHPRISVDPAGIGYAIASGAIASGIGYAVWYAVLPSLKATTAATVQLGVPIVTALGGTLLLAEPLTLRLALAASAVLGGIALVVLRRASVGAPR